jgi:hypothetical protein
MEDPTSQLVASLLNAQLRPDLTPVAVVDVDIGQ